MSSFWTFILGNALTLLVGLGTAVGWLAERFKKTIVQPINQLTDDMTQLKKDMVTVKDSAALAHDRLDRHLEGHNA